MRLWLFGGAVLLILIVGFILLVPHTHDAGKKSQAAVSQPPPPVFVHDGYKKGTHTLTVSVAAPNPCTNVSTVASFIPSSTTPQIAITVTMPVDTGTCLQEPATTTTTLKTEAPLGAVIVASVNGQSATVVTN